MGIITLVNVKLMSLLIMKKKNCFGQWMSVKL